MNISFEKIDELIEVIGHAKSVLENEELEILNFQLLGETSKQVKKNVTKRFIESTLRQAQIPYFHLATRESTANIQLDYCISMFIEQAELTIGKKMEAEEAIGVIKAFSIPSVADIEREFLANCDSKTDMEATCNIYQKRLSGKIDSNTVMQFKTKAKSGFPGFNILHECDLIKEDDLSNIRYCFYYIAINAADLCEKVVDLLNSYSTVQAQQDEKLQQTSKYKIAEGKTTDFIKLISAMYDCRIFENIDGKVASNKKDLIKALTGFFNAEIPDYSPLLSAAKTTANYLDVFDKIKEKGKAYYEKPPKK